MTDDDEKYLTAYYGPNYAQPKLIYIDSFSLDDYHDIDLLIAALTKFRLSNTDVTITAEKSDKDSYSVTGFRATRFETVDEVARRIATYTVETQKKREKNETYRREQYDRLKQEFEGK